MQKIYSVESCTKFDFIIFSDSNMEVAEVTSGDLGPGAVVVGSDGELQYDLSQQTSSFLTNAHIVQQGKHNKLYSGSLLCMFFQH